MPRAGQLPAMEASEPVAAFSPAADPWQGALCIQRRMPAGYPLNLRVNETNDASTVTAFMPGNTIADTVAFRWQIRLTRAATELRTNVGPLGGPFADQPVYDAIAACGFKR